ncbi:hypothetical protein LTR53_008633 [Teratosphaeriaceae sp. CCFEE 6253]|nr:hypothetical protein LTR53_008633 [Teratosphaeriaceae sp. CCFEE 6253]
MDTAKRKAGDDAGREDKRTKSKRQWQVPRKNDRGAVQAKAIQPGDSGIWATCSKGREGKCVSEVRDLFAEYAEHLYGSSLEVGENAGAEAEEPEAVDIESEIKAEVAGIRKPSAVQLFTPVRLDMQCVVFFKTVSPVEPVSFVKKICEDASSGTALRRTRNTNRLTPMTLLGRASGEDLEKVALEVLRPHFHQEPAQSRKFAIRPTIRSHSILTRDIVIKQVASLVGSGHTVDLTDYDLLIVVEINKNICGVSVIDSSFERLKRFNLAELFDPTTKEVQKKIETVLTDSKDMAVDDDSAAVQPGVAMTLT